ncbi:MAG: sodium-dependent transporter [Gammaproteobacteria bacterium]|nr:sodium-dependent transporter [Gammaproteobacteria bacterium]
MALGGETSRHGMWSSRWMFILAAAGSAVGLGNIWRFPFIAGDNGGGAFILVYLLCIFLIGIPIMMAEVLMGREVRKSPINTLRKLVTVSKASPAWVLIGWMGVAAGFFILSFYAVIAGWAMDYVLVTAQGTFAGVTGDGAAAVFNTFLESPLQLMLWQTLFMVLTVWIVARGVSGGLELAIRVLMPLLFILLLVMLGYAVTTGGFGQAAEFMFRFEWERMGVEGVLAAMGQAFFTLSLGMGAIMAYGAYVPNNASVPGTVTIIALLDTVVAIAAGLVIFSIVFANGLEPGQGPGLMFITLPLAFGQMPMGTLFGTVFFVLVSFAAVTSAISLLEPALAFLVEEYNAVRSRVAISLGVITWILGLGTVFSFNVWADVHLVGERTFFDLLDFLTNNIMLPLGGLLMGLFVGWVLPRKLLADQLDMPSLWLNIWLFLVRFVAPLGVLTIFIYTLYRAAMG